MSLGHFQKGPLGCPPPGWRGRRLGNFIFTHCLQDSSTSGFAATFLVRSYYSWLIRETSNTFPQEKLSLPGRFPKTIFLIILFRRQNIKVYVGCQPTKPLRTQKWHYCKWRLALRGLKVNKSAHIHFSIMSLYFSNILPNALSMFSKFSQWSLSPTRDSLYTQTGTIGNSTGSNNDTKVPFTEPRKPIILTKQVPVSLLVSQRGPDGAAPWEIAGGLIKDGALRD